MKTFIVLMPVGNANLDARPSCEVIENTKFNINNKLCDTVNAKQVLNEIISMLELDDECGIEVEPITDFMERVNDSEFKADDYFMSYVLA